MIQKWSNTGQSSVHKWSNTGRAGGAGDAFQTSSDGPVVDSKWSNTGHFDQKWSDTG